MIEISRPRLKHLPWKLGLWRTSARPYMFIFHIYMIFVYTTISDFDSSLSSFTWSLFLRLEIFG